MSTCACAIDIGGTLAKLVYITNHNPDGTAATHAPGGDSGRRDSAGLDQGIQEQDVGFTTSETHATEVFGTAGDLRLGQDASKFPEWLISHGNSDRDADSASVDDDSVSSCESPSHETDSKFTSKEELQWNGSSEDGNDQPPSDSGVHGSGVNQCGNCPSKKGVEGWSTPTSGFDRISRSPYLCSAKELVKPGDTIHVTGGGAYRFHDLLVSKLGVKVRKYDEMDSIMAGLAFLISSTHTTFRYDLSTRKRVLVDLAEPIYPFLVVNIGSGVSILMATAPGKFVRVTGTCIGGGTVLGLARLLCHAESFDEVVRLSEKGTDALDLKVKDLFGDAAGSRFLPGDEIACSFGRLFSDEASWQDIASMETRKEDIARSLISMVSYNIGNIAYLVATLHNVRRVFFAGKYINNTPLTMESITHGVEFYQRHYDTQSSDGPMPSDIYLDDRKDTGSGNQQLFDVLFLLHDGYLGALGALLSPETDSIPPN